MGRGVVGVLLRHSQGGGYPCAGLVLVAGVGDLLVHVVPVIPHGLVHKHAL